MNKEIKKSFSGLSINSINSFFKLFLNLLKRNILILIIPIVLFSLMLSGIVDFIVLFSDYAHTNIENITIDEALLGFSLNSMFLSIIVSVLVCPFILSQVRSDNLIKRIGNTNVGIGTYHISAFLTFFILSIAAWIFISIFSLAIWSIFRPEFMLEIFTSILKSLIIAIPIIFFMTWLGIGISVITRNQIFSLLLSILYLILFYIINWYYSYILYNASLPNGWSEDFYNAFATIYYIVNPLPFFIKTFAEMSNHTSSAINVFLTEVYSLFYGFGIFILIILFDKY